MREIVILNIWIVPLNGLNKTTPYAGHPVGNSPELMPLDFSLFFDLNSSVDYPVTRKTHLGEEDGGKFSISTVTWGVKAYLRILKPPDDLEVGWPTLDYARISETKFIICEKSTASMELPFLESATETVEGNRDWK